MASLPALPSFVPGFDTQGRSYLLVLDARSLDEIGRAYVPHPILFGYHGEFFES